MEFNMTKDEALKMAIDWIEGWSGYSPSKDEALKACKEALEQPAWNEEEFNAIAYAYRSCPANEVKMVNERYQELVDYVLLLKEKNNAM